MEGQQEEVGAEQRLLDLVQADVYCMVAHKDPPDLQIHSLIETDASAASRMDPGTDSGMWSLVLRVEELVRAMAAGSGMRGRRHNDPAELVSGLAGSEDCNVVPRGRPGCCT